ncbi:MAG: DUF4105 domain-containing protein [Treponema sp.]|nr:DUF4105 domain-containing protein [Treponema sp.]
MLSLVEAQEAFPALTDAAVRGKYLTIKLAVAGPGDELYFWWGHIGIVIEDALSGESRFYDWGVFSFDTENFYYDFAYGRLFYSCTVSPANYAIARYIETNRDLIFFTLDLPPESKTELLHFAENNVLPENRDYEYHHFRDNCATRVRDIIDRATEGGFKERFGDAQGRFTLRQHVNRHTWFSPFWGWAFSFLMGQDIDQSITVWEEMFLPSEIAQRCMDFSYIDAFGNERELVSEVEIINQAKGRPKVATVPRRRSQVPALGLFIALAFSLLRLKAAGMLAAISGRKHSVTDSQINEGTAAFQGNSHILGLGQAGLGLFFGIMGSILFFMSFFTNHDYTFHNINIIFVNPMLLAAVPLGFLAAFSKNQKKCQNAEFLLTLLWTLVFLGGIVTIIIRFLPGYYQQNQPVQALILPFAFVLSFFPNWVNKLFRLFFKFN